jgi:peptide deformylase
VILKVALLGNPVLRLKAKPVDLKGIQPERLKILVQEMTETMREYDGVGLAAPQVHLSLQIAVMESDQSPRYPDAQKIPLTVLINPQVRSASRVQEEDWEGCLSVEGLRGRVPRWRAVDVETSNVRGEQIRFRAEGFFARVIQHEADHLNGKVFLDRMKDFSTLTHPKEYTRYWMQG